MSADFYKTLTRAALSAGLVLGLAAGAAVAQVSAPVGNGRAAVSGVQGFGTRSALAAERARIEATAIPREQIMAQRPMAEGRAPARAIDLGQPSVMPGNPGRQDPAGRRWMRTAEPANAGTPAAPSRQIAPQTFGEGNWGTMYHYSDYLQTPFPVTYTPWRAAGRMFFSFDGSSYYSCTASLIHRAILVTAGHCVHDITESANGNNGFIVDAWFVPGYSGSVSPQRYGSCDLLNATTTNGWYNDNRLNEGDDVAMATCSTLSNSAWAQVNGRLPGVQVGWFAWCWSNCTRPYIHTTQIGYPVNYYGGEEMTVSSHLVETAESGGPDFQYGSGMRGGSSGGPHVLNIGWVQDSSTFLGYGRERNTIMAVTSWGYDSHLWKIQGASPLSGPGNSNGIIGIFNTECAISRSAHGTWTCSPL